MRINIPGLESIDINEIIENAPRPVGRRTNFKPRPTRSDTNESPKMPSEAELSKALKELSEQIQSRPSSGTSPVLGSIPGASGIETINIPGVGPIQLPMPQSPTTTEPDPNTFDRFLNPYVPDESAVERMTTSDGGVFSGTTVYDRYDPETDTYYGSQGGAMGMIPFSVKGSEMPQSFKDLFQESQKNQGRMKKPRPGDGDVIYDENPVIGTRPDGTPVRLYDKDSADYLDKQKTNQSPVFDENESTRTGPIETTTQQTPTGSYESNYIDWLESKPQPPTIPKAGRSPGGGPAYKKAQEKYQKDLATWEGSKPTRDSFTQESQSSAPVETKSGEGPKPGTGVADGPVLKPFEGYIPPNIIGTSFDPKELSRHKKKVDKAKARRKPGKPLIFKNPILGTQQTQFGGYGQPMPTAPLMDYAGLASPITYSTPDPDPDAQPGGPPQIPSFDV